MLRDYRLLHILLLILVAGPCVRAQTWKTEAKNQIRALRTAPVTVSVVDGNTPVPDASVNLKMREQAFHWGTTISVAEAEELLLSGVGVGDIHPYWNHFHQFNSVTPENAGKWKQWLSPSKKAVYLESIDWFAKNGIANRGHTAIWPSITRWNAVPDTVLQAPTVEAKRAIIKAHLESYTSELLAKGVYELDLINELINEPDLSRDQLGLSTEAERIAEHTQWHKWAKAAAPELDLIANEYNLYQNGNNFHERFVRYVGAMLEQGAPVDGVGMQGHFFGGVPGYDELKRRLAEVAVLDLPMAVTEFDMSNNTYAEMERVLYSVFSEPLMTGFSLWGAWDGRQWRNSAAIYRQDWSIKPSGEAYFDIVRESWWTDTTATGAELNVDAAYLGAYDVFVEHDGQIFIGELTLDSAREQQSFTIDVSQGGMPLPTANLVILEQPEIIYPNQPFTLGITTTDSLASVAYYDGRGTVLGVVREAPFSLPLTFADAGREVNPTAVLTYTSGYRTEVSGEQIIISSANTAPEIVSVFPASGTSLLNDRPIVVSVTVTDADTDPTDIFIVGESGDTIAAGSGPEARFDLTGLPTGPSNLTVVVSDDKFGSTTQTLALNIIAPGRAAAASVSAPVEDDDDIEEKDDGNIDVSGDLDLGEKLTIVRFPFPAIPAGATIDSAFVQFGSQKDEQGGDASLPIYGELAVNPAPLSGVAGNVSARRPTSERVMWEDLPVWNAVGDREEAQRTPDIATVIQEIVNQEGWSETKPIHLLFGKSDTGGKRSAFGVDQSEEGKAELRVFYTAEVSIETPETPYNIKTESGGCVNGDEAYCIVAGVNWQDDNAGDKIIGYNIEINGELWPIVVTQKSLRFPEDLEFGYYTVRIQAIGCLGVTSDFSEPIFFTNGNPAACGPSGPNAIPNGLTVEDIGKTYFPNPNTVPAYLQYTDADRGGTTSVRRSSPATLKWKTQGYYQRNRELGQVFNVPEGESVTLDALVLRTGNTASAVLSNTPGARLYIEFFEVMGTPTINDNGTPMGTDSEHGFSKNHRTDDYLDGISYVPLAIARGGVFPDIAPTTQTGGQEGHLRYLRWNLENEAELTLEGGKRYAFIVGFEESGDDYGFSLGNNNLASSPAAPALRKDTNGQEWWSMRREGDGTLPPTQIPGESPPTGDSLRMALLSESLYTDGHECNLPPTTDGFPDVDTYRTLEFYLETRRPTSVFSTPAPLPVKISPSPARAEVTLTLVHAGKTERGTISIYDITGKLVSQRRVRLVSGDNQFAIARPQGLAAGNYHLRLQAGSDTYGGKISWY